MHALLSAVAAHPEAALAIVALVAFGESVALVGTFVPAAVVMFAAGALVGSGSLDLWTTLAVASAGAVAGDGLSYELGRAQQARIRAWRFFREHAEAVARGEAFLARHGGKSIVFARFLGAVRAVVPLLAGFARMPRRRFYAVNVFSALLWAPAHILPGVIFGSSLQLAEAVSGRLAVLVALLAALAWGAAWLASAFLRYVPPALRRARDLALARARRGRSAAARGVVALLDPARPASHALLVGALLLLAAGWLFLGVVEDVAHGDPLVQADFAVFRFLQELRNAPMDRAMVALTELGSAGVLVPVALAVLARLAWRRAWRTAGYWLAAVGFGELLVLLVKAMLGRHRPLDLYAGLERYALPSGHATIATVVAGFLAFLLARGGRVGMRLAIASGAAVYVALVAFSRLYLGAHWLSDVVAGAALGLAWVAVLAMTYAHRGVREDFGRGPTALVAALAFLGSAAAWMHWRAAADAARYVEQPAAAKIAVALAAWRDGAWRTLPARRRELAGDEEERFTVQWACDADRLRSALLAAGWRPAPAWSVKAAVGALAPHPALDALPVLPRFDRGGPAALAWIRASASDAGQREVLRLWPSRLVLTTGEPVWYGAAYRETARHAPLLPLPLRQVPLALPALRQALPAQPFEALVRRRGAGPSTLLVACVRPAA